LNAGLLRKGDDADFIIVDSLEDMNVQETWIKGEKVFSKGKVLFRYEPDEPVNRFYCEPVHLEDLKVRNKGKELRVIVATEGELLTEEILIPTGNSEVINTDTHNDLLKIVVKDRYKNSSPAMGFIKGFGLKEGAIASSIAHDSHNIIAVGTNDLDIVNCINEIVRLKGGLAVSATGKVKSVQLDIGGIMTTRSCDDIAHEYNVLNILAGEMGCNMKAPFMTLSFMALLVIPDLKIGDQGLFDVKKFEKVSLFV
jgi:adenine deaminase